jgi:hypothetical protein
VVVVGPNAPSSGAFTLVEGGWERGERTCSGSYCLSGVVVP